MIRVVASAAFGEFFTLCSRCHTAARRHLSSLLFSLLLLLSRTYLASRFDQVGMK